MSDLKFNVSTDVEHEIKLDSHLVYAAWTSGAAYGGQKARCEVGTAFVGQGAKIKIHGKSENGKDLGKLKGVIKNNKFKGELDIPEDIEPGDMVYFEVDLPQVGLKDVSESIPAFPPIEVTDMKWSASEARRGDILTLSADIKGLRNGVEVRIIIYEDLGDRIFEKLTELTTEVIDEKVEAKWEYEYHAKTGQIPSEDEIQKYSKKEHYRHPEYFFTIKIGDTEFGREQKSKLLKFKDWFEISLTYHDGETIPNEKYILTMPDGSKRDGSLDSNGRAREEDIPPGEIFVKFPSFEYITFKDGGN